MFHEETHFKIQMKKRLLLISFLLWAFYPATAQRKIREMDPQKAEQDQAARDYEKNTSPWTDRLTYGGNFWISGGSGSLFIYLQPLVGYKVNENLIAGGGVTYIYWSQRRLLSNGKYLDLNDNAFGLNLFARHTVFGPVFAHIEYMPMNFTTSNRVGDSQRIWANALFLGGGYNQSVGGMGGYILVLYDVLWQSDPVSITAFRKSFYQSPWNIRFGVMF